MEQKTMKHVSGRIMGFVGLLGMIDDFPRPGSADAGDLSPAPGGPNAGGSSEAGAPRGASGERPEAKDLDGGALLV
jgi:hypothetical protein